MQNYGSDLNFRGSDHQQQEATIVPGELSVSFLCLTDVKPSKWEDRVTVFVVHLIQSNHQSARICSYISAIKAVLNEDKVKISNITNMCL